MTGYQISRLAVVSTIPSTNQTHETSTVRERRKIKSGEQGAKPLDYFGKYGAPGTIRTCDRLVRSQVLYPAELRAQKLLRGTSIELREYRYIPGSRCCLRRRNIAVFTDLLQGPDTIVTNQTLLNMVWRRARDSNPRWALTHTPLAGVRLQPLGQLSLISSAQGYWS
jgi:hypothetical protein